MKRKAYSAGAVKFSFWFLEFRKVVQLLSAGKDYDEIKRLNEEENIYEKNKTKIGGALFVDKEGNKISISEEPNVNLGEIIVNGEITLENCEDESGQREVNIYVNSELILTCNLNGDENLSDVRTKIKDQIPNDAIFLDNEGDSIEKKDEGE